MPAGYQLDASALKGVLGALEREYEDSRLSSFQHACFSWLRSTSYTFTLLVAAVIVLELLRPLLRPLALALQPIGLAVLATGAVLVFLNVPLITKAIRQYRLVRRLRLLRVAEEFWVRGARPARNRKLQSAVYLAVPTMLALAFLYSTLSGQADESLAVTPAQTALVLAICVGVPFALEGLDWALTRLRDRLDHFDEVALLRDALAAAESEGADGITELPRDLAIRLGDMEKLHILERQAEAISHRGDGESYSIARSDAFREACRKLSLRERDLVEEELFVLGHAAAGQREDVGARQEGLLHVADTAIAIAYVIDHPSRTIAVTELRKLPESETDGEAS